jgi:hypothetical protein
LWGGVGSGKWGGTVKTFSLSSEGAHFSEA